MCASNLHGVGLALYMYAQDHHGSFLPVWTDGRDDWAGTTFEIGVHRLETLEALFDEYAAGVYKTFECPNMPGPFEQEMRRHQDPATYGRPYQDWVYMGYQYLGKAAGQPTVVGETWPHGVPIASSIELSEPDLPLFADWAAHGVPGRPFADHWYYYRALRGRRRLRVDTAVVPEQRRDA